MLRNVLLSKQTSLLNCVSFIYNKGLFCRNNEILFSAKLINSTDISNDYSTTLVGRYNATNATDFGFKTIDWGFKVCNIETMLSEVGEGTGLAFIVFTQAIVELPGSPFWAVLFFTMLLSLGLGSQIGILEGMLCTSGFQRLKKTFLCHKISHFLFSVFDIDIFKRVRKPYLTGVVCIFCFFVGLIFTTGAGEYWLKMFDSFAGTLGLVVVAFMEMIAVIYVYGHKK